MANNTEQIGVNHIGEIAARNKWMFRPQPIDDVGIDAHMELTEPTGESKQLLALQIKSGASWFKERKDECIIFRGLMKDNTIIGLRILCPALWFCIILTMICAFGKS